MVLRCIVATLLIGLSGVYAEQLRNGVPAAEEVPALDRLPRELNGWRSRDFESGETETEVLAADTKIHRRYRRKDGVEVWLAIAYFAEQQVNSQIHSPRNCLPGSGWRVVSLEDMVLGSLGKDHAAKRMIIAKNQRRQEVLYWFRTQGGMIAGEYALKWDLVKSSLARRPTNAVFIRYNADPSQSDAIRELNGLLQPRLDEILGEVGL